MSLICQWSDSSPIDFQLALAHVTCVLDSWTDMRERSWYPEHWRLETRSGPEFPGPGPTLTERKDSTEAGRAAARCSCNQSGAWRHERARSQLDSDSLSIVTLRWPPLPPHRTKIENIPRRETIFRPQGSDMKMTPTSVRPSWASKQRQKIEKVGHVVRNTFHTQSRGWKLLWLRVRVCPCYWAQLNLANANTQLSVRDMTGECF